MPNYCMNQLKLFGEIDYIKDFFQKIKSENSLFDFQNIVPMPKNIEDTERGSKSFASEAVCLFLSDGTISNHLRWMLDRYQIKISELDMMIETWQQDDKIDLELGYKIIENRQLYQGCGDWYEWCINNWGTKWQPMNVEIDGQILSFDTAWSPPQPIIEQIGEKFKKLSFEYRYYEPGICLAGLEYWAAGVCEMSESYDYDDEGYQKLARLFHDVDEE